MEYHVEVKSCAERVFPKLHKAFMESFGNAYVSAWQPHEEAVEDLPILYDHSRNPLHNTSYIHSNITMGTVTDGPTQICAHDDRHTVRWADSDCIPIAWIPRGPCPPDTAFGFPYMARHGMYLKIEQQTFSLTNDTFHHNTSSTDLGCAIGSTMYALEFGVNEKLMRKESYDRATKRLRSESLYGVT